MDDFSSAAPSLVELPLTESVGFKLITLPFRLEVTVECKETCTEGEAGVQLDCAAPDKAVEVVGVWES